MWQPQSCAQVFWSEELGQWAEAQPKDLLALLVQGQRALRPGRSVRAMAQEGASRRQSPEE